MGVVEAIVLIIIVSGLIGIGYAFYYIVSRIRIWILARTKNTRKGDHKMTNPESSTSEVLSLEDRKRILANYIAGQIVAGQRVESQTDTSAVLVKGKPVNHTLHLLVVLFTVWFGYGLIHAIIWICFGIFGGEKRNAVRVDDYGNIL